MLAAHEIYVIFIYVYKFACNKGNNALFPKRRSLKEIYFFIPLRNYVIAILFSKV